MRHIWVEDTGVGVLMSLYLLNKMTTILYKQNLLMYLLKRYFVLKNIFITKIFTTQQKKTTEILG